MVFHINDRCKLTQRAYASSWMTNLFVFKCIIIFYIFLLKEEKQILLATKIKIAVLRDAAYRFFQGTLYFKLPPDSMVELWT